MKELVNLRLDNSDLEILKEMARKDDRTVSYLIRMAIKKFITPKTELKQSRELGGIPGK